MRIRSIIPTLFAVSLCWSSLALAATEPDAVTYTLRADADWELFDAAGVRPVDLEKILATSGDCTKWVYYGSGSYNKLSVVLPKYRDDFPSVKRAADDVLVILVHPIVSDAPWRIVHVKDASVKDVEDKDFLWRWRHKNRGDSKHGGGMGVVPGRKKRHRRSQR